MGLPHWYIIKDGTSVIYAQALEQSVIFDLSREFDMIKSNKQLGVLSPELPSIIMF